MPFIQRCARRETRGFTLVELLVVILILMVLAGLLFPALVHAQTVVRKKKAKAEAIELAKAWEAYWDAYQGWTLPLIFQMKDDKVAILAGLDTAANTNSLKLMDFDKTEMVNGVKDPWKTLYQVHKNPNSDTVESKQEYWNRAYMANRKRYVYTD